MDDLAVALSMLLFLAVASLYEWRTKRVPNWLALTALALAALWRAVSGRWVWLTVVVWVVCFAAWHAGALGGGDAKVLMALGTLRPDTGYLAWLVMGWALVYFVVAVRRQPGTTWARLQSTTRLVLRAFQTPHLSADLKDPFVVVMAALTAGYWLAVALLAACPLQAVALR